MRSHAFPSITMLLRTRNEARQKYEMISNNISAGPSKCNACPRTRIITTPSGSGMNPIRRATRSEWSVKACNNTKHIDDNERKKEDHENEEMHASHFRLHNPLSNVKSFQ